MGDGDHDAWLEEKLLQSMQTGRKTLGVVRPAETIGRTREKS